MKQLLVIVALTTALAAPAFAQQAPNARDVQTSRQQGSSRVHVYAPDYYQVWHGNQSANPDFQLGYSK